MRKRGMKWLAEVLSVTILLAGLWGGAARAEYDDFVENFGFARSPYTVGDYFVYSMVTGQQGTAYRGYRKDGQTGEYATDKDGAYILQGAQTIPANAGVLVLFHADGYDKLALHRENRLWYEFDGMDDLDDPDEFWQRALVPIPASCADWEIGRAQRTLAVYRTASMDAPALGVIPQGVNAVYRAGVEYDQVVFGDTVGYVAAGQIACVDRDAMVAEWDRQDRRRITSVDWDYSSLYSGDREVGLFGLHMQRCTIVLDSVRAGSDAVITEYFWPKDRSIASELEFVRENDYLLYFYLAGCIPIPAAAEFPLDAATYCYHNEEANALIFYSGSDRAVLWALRNTHGAPFHVIKKGEAGRPSEKEWWYAY